MVKLATHILFSASTAFYIGTAIRTASPSFLAGIPLLIAASVCSFLVNNFIDGFGHRKRGAYHVRTKLTHSLSGATLFSLASAAILLVLMNLFCYALPSVEAFSLETSWATSAEIVVLCLVCGYSHLLADLPTEGGIYFKGRRVKLGGFSYDGPINIVFLLVSLLLFLLSVTTSSP